MTLNAKVLEEFRDRQVKILAGGGADKAPRPPRPGPDDGARTSRRAVPGRHLPGNRHAHSQRPPGRHGDTKTCPPTAWSSAPAMSTAGWWPPSARTSPSAAARWARCTPRRSATSWSMRRQAGSPVVAFNDSGGARIQEGVDSLSGYGQVFFRNVLLSGVVPQIAVICGPCAGGAAYSPALMDFVIMTEEERQHVHQRAGGHQGGDRQDGDDGRDRQRRRCTPRSAATCISSPRTTPHAISIVQQASLTSCRPTTPRIRRTGRAPTSTCRRTRDQRADPEDDPKARWTCAPSSRALVDRGDFLEVHRRFAENIIVGFARIEGIVVGIIANQPAVQAGTLDIDASDKGARFIRFCNFFNIPLVTLVDVPGFLPGVEQERGGIIRHGAKMLFAYAASTVPKVTVILRKAYGGSYLAMCSRDMGADFVFAWPTAEIAVMGAEGAVKVLYNKELKAAPDRQGEGGANSPPLIGRSSPRPIWRRRKAISPTSSTRRSTRSTIALALRKALSKREVRPPKKHGNIPCERRTWRRRSTRHDC